jgi:3-deoxy-D-manno-octulosonic-acid transferase
MSFIAAQETMTAQRLQRLGATNVRVTGSLKSAAPPLSFDAHSLERARLLFSGQKPWLAASTHLGDEKAALASQVEILAKDPTQILILAPRDTARAQDIKQEAEDQGLRVSRRSQSEKPSANTAVYIADTYGELGIWYRLCDRALIGGGFDNIGGHNPWEAAALDTAIFFGPDTANFKADYVQLSESKAAVQVTTDSLVAELLRTDLKPLASNAAALSKSAQTSLQPLAADLCALLPEIGP